MDLEKMLTMIKINMDAVKKITEEKDEDDFRMPDWKISQLPEFGSRILDFQFLTLINSMNFCFIPVDERPRWKNPETGEEGAFGMFSVVAKLFRSILDEKNMIKYEELEKIDLNRLRELFITDDSRGVMPLLEERVKILHEMAEGFKRFDFSQVKFSRGEFIEKLVDAFPSYNDVMETESGRLEIMKRAQLLIAMLVARGIIELSDPENIDLFADYRVPQVLREFGILEYSEELVSKLRNKIYLEENSQEEREIRIATILAGRVLRENFYRLSKKVNCIELDYYLWMKSREINFELEYHRTFSTLY